MNLKQTDLEIEIPFYPYPEEAFIEATGMKHHVYIWPKVKYSGVFFVMHGMDGHAGSTGTLAKYINEQTDLVVIGYDFRNYGKSIHDLQGFIDSVDTLIVDAEAVVDMVVKKYQPGKLFLAGISMGGGVAFRMAIRRNYLYDGIVMLSPALRGNAQNGPCMKKMGQLMGWLFPRWKFMEQGSGTGNRHSCFNGKTDPLNYQGKIILGSVKAILDSMEENEKLLDKLETPYLMVVGGGDKIIDPFVAIDLDRLSKSKDKTTKVYPEMWHYVPLEPEYMTDIIPQVAKWLRERST